MVAGVSQATRSDVSPRLLYQVSRRPHEGFNRLEGFQLQLFFGSVAQSIKLCLDLRDHNGEHLELLLVFHSLLHQILDGHTQTYNCLHDTVQLLEGQA